MNIYREKGVGVAPWKSLTYSPPGLESRSSYLVGMKAAEKGRAESYEKVDSGPTVPDGP